MFGGSAAVALALLALAPFISGPGGSLPAWGFLAFVVAIDVAHVHSTLYRTYLDGEELRRRPFLYAGVPLGCFVLGFALHTVSSDWFWRGLAYVAVLHFVRQQAGWVAIYRARARLFDRVDRVIDDLAIYAATLYPLAYWHVHLPRSFHWFLEGDFVGLSSLTAALPFLRGVWASAMMLYVGRAVFLWITRRALPIGKHLVVGTTALTWYLGIVATNSDFEFTVANVIVHGVPYVALLYFYAKERARERPKSLVAHIVIRGGFAIFIGVLLMLAFLEEMIWDRFVWHVHPSLFGGAGSDLQLGDGQLAILVPLLAVPQATHYVLDAVLWRRRDTGAAQARALGFSRAPDSARPAPARTVDPAVGNPRSIPGDAGPDPAVR